MVDLFFQGFPRLMEVKHGDKHGNARRRNKHQLAGARQGIYTIDADDDGKEQNEEDDGRQRENVFY